MKATEQYYIERIKELQDKLDKVEEFVEKLNDDLDSGWLKEPLLSIIKK